LGDVGQAEALLLQAEAHLLSKMPDATGSAVAAAEEAVASCSEGEARLGAWAQLQVGSGYLAEGRHEEALRAAQEAKAAFQKLGSSEGQAASLIEVCIPALLAASGSAGGESPLGAALEARSIAREAKDSRLEALALRSLAAVQLHMGQAAESLVSFGEALSLFRCLDRDRQAEAATQRAAVEAHLAAGDLDGALEAEREALRLFRDLRDSSAEASSLRGLAELHVGRGQLKEASEAAEAARELLQELRDWQAELEVLERLIFTLKGQGALDKALRAAQRCLVLRRERGRSEAPEVARALCTIAGLRISLSQVEEAVEAGRAAEAIFKRLGDQKGEADVLLDIVARVELLKGEPDLAVLAAEQAAALSKAAGDAISEAKALEVAASQYVATARHAEALRLLGEAAGRFRSAGEQLAECRMLTVAVDAHLAAGHAA
ncbi:unnamed protein product, partial [Polarella glacialis]